jgi:PAS domain S-box-containing protein
MLSDPRSGLLRSGPFREKMVVMKLFARWENFSLRIKATLLIEGLVVTVVLVTGVIATMHEKKILEGELQKRGLALASDLAELSLRPLLSKDLPTLRRFVNHYMEQDYVRYALVLDPQGKVVMHNHLDEVGKTYNDSLTLAALGSFEPGFTYANLSKMEERYCDIFVPIVVSNVRLGTIRLGYSYRAVEKEIATARNRILLVGFTTTIIGGVIAYFLAGFISAPIKRITNAIQKVANGELDTELKINRNDELGALVHSFNKMTEDLRKTTISKDYVDNIIGSMNDTLIVTDSTAKIKSVNRATCELLEYRENELVGKEIGYVVAGKERIFNPEEFGKPNDEKTLANYEVEYISRRGLQIPMLLSTSVLRTKGGKIAGIVMLARDIEERKRAEEALRESESRLRFLSTRLLTIQEEERRRLSAELHDELGQALVLFKIQLRSIQGELKTDQAKLKGECDDLIGDINELSENVRRLSRDLSPAILEDLGFLAAIRRLADGFAKQFYVKISFDISDSEELFPQEAQIIAYRIIQECFTNIAKHSQANNIFVQIGKRDGDLVFRVEDDGIGFNVKEILGRDSNTKGLGIPAMFERALMLKGFCDIQSREAIGTIVTCTIPIGDQVRRV